LAQLFLGNFLRGILHKHSYDILNTFLTRTDKFLGMSSASRQTCDSDSC